VDWFDKFQCLEICGLMWQFPRFSDHQSYLRNQRKNNTGLFIGKMATVTFGRNASLLIRILGKSGSVCHNVRNLSASSALSSKTLMVRDAQKKLLNMTELTRWQSWPGSKTYITNLILYIMRHHSLFQPHFSNGLHLIMFQPRWYIMIIVNCFGQNARYQFI